MKTKLALIAIIAAWITFANPSMVRADFIGNYDPGNWTESFPGTIAGGDGRSTSHDATTLMLVGGDASGALDACSLDPCRTDRTISISANAVLTFDWDYETFDVDGPFADPFGFLLNDIFTPLTDNFGANMQSGSEAIAVLAGDVFGFSIDCGDCIFGRAIANVTNFNAVPEPSTLLLLGVGLFGLAAIRRHLR